MTTPPQYQVRPMSTFDLERVLTWRNHLNVRRYMYTQHEITLAEHTRWFEQVSKDTSYHLLIFEVDGKPFGFINLHQIANGNIADWGFYVAPWAPRGIGKQLGQAALHYAFITLGIHKVCGQVLSYNKPSIRFHHQLGFQEEGKLQEYHFDGEHYHDVVCFGLGASEWHASN